MHKWSVELKNKCQLSQSLPQRNNTLASLGMQRWLLLLQYTESRIHISTTKKKKNTPKKQNKTKNYDGVETRKKLALYENIKFYDYIP